MDSAGALKELLLLDRYAGNMRLAAEEWKNPWQTLISIILSARTRDETTIAVAKNLFENFPDAEFLANAEVDEVEKIIRQVNYYKTKSRNIISCSKKIYEEYNNRVPIKEEPLLKLPGVGRKTANVFLSEMGKNAIGVDTHVSYISQKLGWTENTNPHKIESDLRRLFPEKYWKRINSILVRFGKTYVSKKKQDKILREVKLNAGLSSS